MKKLVLLLFLFVSALAYSQPKGIGSVISVSNEKEHVSLLSEITGQMYYINYGKSKGTYYAYFPQTPVGTKRAIDRVHGILVANNRSLHKPDVEDDLFASYVSSILDYQSLNTSLVVGSSEVFRAWDFEDNWRVALIMDEDTRAIFILKLE